MYGSFIRYSMPVYPGAQWVLSLTERLRPYLHNDLEVAGAVLRTFLRGPRDERIALFGQALEIPLGGVYLLVGNRGRDKPSRLRGESDNVTFDSMTLGDLQNLTMLAVARLGRDAIAGRVREMLAELADREVSVSTVFVTLTRLEDQGLVSSRPGDAPARGGRRTRVFALTKPGWEALRRTRAASERLWEGLQTP